MFYLYAAPTRNANNPIKKKKSTTFFTFFVFSLEEFLSNDKEEIRNPKSVMPTNGI